MESERRLQKIQNHLISSSDEHEEILTLEESKAELLKNEGFSVILPEKLSEGKWNVYRSIHSPFKLIDTFPQPNINTLHDNFEYAVKSFPNVPFLGTRVRSDGTVGEYEWLTYNETSELRNRIGSGLIQRGFNKGEKIGLYFLNRKEWIVVEQACYSFGFVSVPLYDTLGPDSVKYIINHSEISVIFCTKDKLQTILDCLEECKLLKLIVVIDSVDVIIPPSKSFPQISIVSYLTLENEGKSKKFSFSPFSGDDMVSICYTSGTTGIPKGAMLTNKSMIANAAGMCFNASITAGDVHISYLPLAHIYERMNIQTLIHFGASVGFYQGDIMKLMDDLEVLKPTIFASVPRLYNRIFDRITATVNGSGALKKYLFNVAYNAKKQALEKGKTPSPVWDQLVFNKIKSRLGGRVKFMITGASPISNEVLEFLKICFGSKVIEGYGMTESTCTISSVDENDHVSGHVGSPNPACEIKLDDVPEMQYFSTDVPFPRGEICVRGPVVFKGYYKDEIQTREVVDEEGWLHTGDIGMWLEGGRLKIIDRKKNIFKLAQGEYIAPEKIENVYLKSPFIAQVFVHGDSLNSQLVAIVAVDAETLLPWAKSKGIQDSEDVTKLCKNGTVKNLVLADMDRVGQEAKLRGFEFVKDIFLTPEPFSLENGLLTPTFKIKRPQAQSYFEKQIKELYEGLNKKEKEASLSINSKL